MSTHHNSLFSLARSKLHLSVGGRDSERHGLHRWVLLKNSIVSSPTSSFTSPASSSTTHPSAVGETIENSDPASPDDDSEAFMFPDAGKLLHTHTAQSSASEAQWLDTLLQNLGEDDDDDFSMDTPVSQVEDDDDSFFLSPLASPMSSSDDLISGSTLFQPHPYPVVYPPYHSPSNRWDSFHSSSAPYDDPFPYHDVDDIELSMPDAIEDTSDDESDAPTTPSLGRSNEAFPVIDPASVPLPTERSRLRNMVPHVYVEADHNSFYPYALPFSRDLYSYNTEC